MIDLHTQQFFVTVVIGVDIARVYATSVLLVGVLFLGTAGQAADAQSRGDPYRPRTSEPPRQAHPPRRTERPRQVPRERQRPDLSDWARPEKETGRLPWNSGTAAATPSSTPSNPDRTPIGGLGWLAAFGMGYGIYRLRREDE